jgi:hypothetical protein
MGTGVGAAAEVRAYEARQTEVREMMAEVLAVDAVACVDRMVIYDQPLVR